MADHEHDERTSLVRSNSALNRANSPPHNYNNGYNTGNGHYHHNNNNRGDFARRDPRTLLAQVQRGLAPFQAWAAKILHAGEESSAVNWVQNARVARTFMMIINTIIAVLAFILIGVEVVEMVLREPLLDYLLPESEITLFAAGATIVAGAFGFAVAYNLLVEEDTTDRNEGNNNEGHRGNSSGGNGEDLGPRNPTPPNSDNIFGQNNDPPLVTQQQQTRHPRLMFTKASTYLLNGNAAFLTLILITFIIAIVQRSIHLSQMDKELNSVWTDAIRHRAKLISEFEIHHQCCGFYHITDRPFPPVINKRKPDDTRPLTCNENPLYGYKVPCKAELAKDFERWQRGIQRLLLVQVTMLVPLFLLVVALSAIGLLKLKARKQEGLEDVKAQAKATAAVPAADGRGGAQYERALLEDVNSHNGGTSLLIGVDAEPATLTLDRPVVQPSLI
ncbi:hypothetical protein BGX21_002889 [Mortierella sp. AD011]|nr:hypothetical protein BGX20_010296 [Mortierella sp. AD010]KAF9378528.1 hypothetical protein BGX21_002889 [Mortierella sp. AD011]